MRISNTTSKTHHDGPPARVASSAVSRLPALCPMNEIFQRMVAKAANSSSLLILKVALTMLPRSLVATMVFCLGARAALAAELPARPVEVMVVGVFHMANPGHDLHNLKVDDVLEPKRQGEIAAH
jgi:hypothetical protein